MCFQRKASKKMVGRGIAILRKREVADEVSRRQRQLGMGTQAEKLTLEWGKGYLLEIGRMYG